MLGGDYNKVSIGQLNISEDLKNDSTLISCDMTFGAKSYSLKGTGRGLVDALFGALLASLKKDYVSLENIALQDFVVTVDAMNINITVKIITLLSTFFIHFGPL